MMKKIFVFLAVASIASSCCRYDMTEILLQRQDVSLTWKGTLQMRYDPDSCQMGYSTDSNEFRVYDDSFGNWFVIRCGARPSNVGQTLKADVQWTTHDDTRTERGAEFTVEKTDSEGNIWMWCKSKKIGVVVRLPKSI